MLRWVLHSAAMNPARTDRNNNPTAFITEIAKAAGLIEHTDYEQGDPFTVPGPKGPYTLYTAKLLKDPIALTIQVIDKLGFYVQGGQRWSYIALSKWMWDGFTPAQKLRTIGDMYAHEGGVAMRHLFTPQV
jgi:hypothetical protein